LLRGPLVVTNGKNLFASKTRRVSYAFYPLDEDCERRPRRSWDRRSASRTNRRLTM
jgi:hypothetical protein